MSNIHVATGAESASGDLLVARRELERSRVLVKAGRDLATVDNILGHVLDTLATVQDELDIAVEREGRR